MNKKTRIMVGSGAGVALLAAAAAAFALAPETRGPAAADLNKDGQVSAAEIEESGKRRFAEADSNKDGKLTGAEIPRRREGHGGRHGEGGRDRGPDGAPMYQVVQPAAIAPTPGQAPPTAQVAPALPGATAQPPAPQTVMLVPVRPEPPRMDSDGDGAVTLAEFMAGYRQRLARADRNGDGVISADELAARPHGPGGRP
jgi:hypothetical protein